MAPTSVSSGRVARASLSSSALVRNVGYLAMRTTKLKDATVKPEIVKAGDEAAELLANLGEVVLDSLLVDGLIKDLPILGSIVGVIKSTLAIRDHAFIRKLALFVLESSAVSDKAKREFKEHLSSDPEFKKSTATHLTIVLDRLDVLEKAGILGRVFAAFIEGKITQAQLRRLSAALDRVLVEDLAILRDFLHNNQSAMLPRECFDGLESAGLVLAYHSTVRSVAPNERQGITVDKQPILVTAMASLLVELAFSQ